jgi:putative heme-binding domain-containing protein
LREPVPFGKTFTAAMVLAADKLTTFLGVDTQGARTGSEALHAGRLLIGARSVGHGKAPEPTGFFHGEIFEVLVYERALAGEEIAALNRYFTSKYAGVVYIAEVAKTQAAGAIALAAVENPPVIQPLVPGFVARKLPVALNNINFLRYRADGRLYAGAYDGKIYVLRDTDGDGIEDTAEIFYQAEDLKLVMGLALTPPGYPRGEGVFVATRGRVLLILDKDRDGKGDEVVTVTQDWEKAKVLGGGVSDALGLALGPDGSVYFTLATHDFTNAYLLDAATGKAGYITATQRGTVQRVSPDFSTREMVSTGLRVNVGLAFNAAGDLFATEQEGATWLANGNPFDELLHIRARLHYGFPPYHPQHLAGVVDELSTFDYAPQHQSAVGLCFDEPVADGAPIFGPAWWRGDALVAAMSRGKINHTKLVKTAAGYVAKDDVIAQLQRIIIDEAVSPSGALALTLHGGWPDWGTGPTGAGELWKIEPAKQPLPPQPVMAWSASPQELRVSFDRPLSAEALAAMQDKVRVVQGRYAQAGDRFETMRPGYQVVKNQLAAPRFQVAVQTLALADDGRTLVIPTGERTAAVGYTISTECDAFHTNTGTSYAGRSICSRTTGLEAGWQSATGEAVKAWLPHADFAVSHSLTDAGGAQRTFFAKLREPGTVTLRGQLDLGRMLYPAIQEGSKLDWEYPREQVTVVLEAARPFQLTVGKDTAASHPQGTSHTARQSVTGKHGSWFPFTVAFAAGVGDPALTAHWFTDRSATPRPFPLRRVLLPYAQPQDAPPMPHNEDLPVLTGGNWANGKTLFQGLCAVCHKIRGEGGRVGPELTNLIYRDYDSVLRDIRDPNAASNPEHVAYTVTKKDGSVLAAVLVAENANSISLAQPGGEVIEVPRAEIAAMQQLAISLMPPGLDKAVTAEQLRDLMSFLLLKEPK